MEEQFGGDNDFLNATYYACVVTCSNYGKLRSAGFAGFEDIPAVAEDRQQMLKNLPKMKFDPSNICEM